MERGVHNDHQLIVNSTDGTGFAVLKSDFSVKKGGSDVYTKDEGLSFSHDQEAQSGCLRDSKNFEPLNDALVESANNVHQSIEIRDKTNVQSIENSRQEGASSDTNIHSVRNVSQSVQNYDMNKQFVDDSFQISDLSEQNVQNIENVDQIMGNYDHNMQSLKRSKQFSKTTVQNVQQLHNFEQQVGDSVMSEQSIENSNQRSIFSSQNSQTIGNSVEKAGDSETNMQSILYSEQHILTTEQCFQTLKNHQEICGNLKWSEQNIKSAKQTLEYTDQTSQTLENTGTVSGDVQFSSQLISDAEQSAVGKSDQAVQTVKNSYVVGTIKTLSQDISNARQITETSYSASQIIENMSRFTDGNDFHKETTYLEDDAETAITNVYTANESLDLSPQDLPLPMESKKSTTCQSISGIEQESGNSGKIAQTVFNKTTNNSASQIISNTTQRARNVKHVTQTVTITKYEYFD